MARRRDWRTRGGFTRETDNLGVTETLRQLREMGEHVVTAAKNALKQGADEVVADAKNRCPVRTGKLRDSIRAEPNSNETSFKIIADAKDAHGFEYGQIVEFSPTINKPFLYPAYEANYGRIMSNIRTSISNAIRSG